MSIAAYCPNCNKLVDHSDWFGNTDHRFGRCVSRVAIKVDLREPIVMIKRPTVTIAYIRDGETLSDVLQRVAYLEVTI